MGIRQGYPLLPLTFNIILQVQGSVIKQKKEKEHTEFAKKEVKLSVFRVDMIVCVEIQTNFPLELISDFSKSAKIHITSMF